MTNVGKELSFELPHQEIESFTPLFSKLEENKKELGIENYSVGVTTLEEVFLRTAEDSINNSEIKADPYKICLLYTSPSPRDQRGSRMPSSA